MDNERWRIPDHVVSREVEEETVLLNLESGIYFGLNRVGTRIWNGLVSGAAPAEIRSSITSAFAIDEATVARDMEGLIKQLVSKGLLER